MSGRTAVLEFLKLLADSIKFGVDEMVVKVVEYMLYKKKGIWWEDLLVREPWRFCPTLEEVAGQSNTLLFIYIMAKKAGELGVSVDPRELYRYLSNEAEWKRFEDMLLTHRGDLHRVSDPLRLFRSLTIQIRTRLRSLPHPYRRGAWTRLEPKAS